MPVAISSFEWGSVLLAELETRKPSLVVLDLRMPGLSGVETLRRIRASGNDVRVVVFSTASLQHEVEECQRLGVEGFYVKPAHFADYVETVRRILRRVVEPGTRPGLPA